MNFKLDKRKICIAITCLSIIALLACEIVGFERFFDEDTEVKLISNVEMAVTRAIGSVVFITILVYLGYKVLNPVKKPFWRGILFTLPAFCVVINNFPIYPVASGLAVITAPPWRIAILAVECLAVSLFEETCFRGVVFLGFLRKRSGTILGRFLSIVFSAAVFGVVHLVNIALGASPVAVVLQIGYSFLIGAMCSVVLMKTSNLWLCVLLHAIFNFGGSIIDDCGIGIIWEPFTVTLTVIIAVATTVYMVLAFLKIKESEIYRIYN